MTGYCPDCGNTLCLCDEIPTDQTVIQSWMRTADYWHARALRFEAERDALRAQFIKHRTTTHKLLGATGCLTCQESDVVLGMVETREGE